MLINLKKKNVRKKVEATGRNKPWENAQPLGICMKFENVQKKEISTNYNNKKLTRDAFWTLVPLD